MSEIPNPYLHPRKKIVTLGGKEKPIVNAEYEKENGNNYTLYLYFSSKRAERVEIVLNKDLHMRGNSIYLKHKEEKHTPVRDKKTA